MKEVAQKTGERARLAGGKPSAVAGGRAAGAAQGCPGSSRTASARVDRAPASLAEWCHGKLHGKFPRRVPEPRMVSLPRRSKGDHRSTAAAQRSAAAFESQLSHAQRVRGARSKTSAPSGNRRGRCGTWGVRALPPGDGPNAAVPRRATIPSGHVQLATEAISS
jgi:hypothetical protein